MSHPFPRRFGPGERPSISMCDASLGSPGAELAGVEEAQCLLSSVGILAPPPAKRRWEKALRPGMHKAPTTPDGHTLPTPPPSVHLPSLRNSSFQSTLVLLWYELNTLRIGIGGLYSPNCSAG